MAHDTNLIPKYWGCSQTLFGIFKQSEPSGLRVHRIHRAMWLAPQKKLPCWHWKMVPFMAVLVKVAEQCTVEAVKAHLCHLGLFSKPRGRSDCGVTTVCALLVPTHTPYAAFEGGVPHPSRVQMEYSL